MTVFELRAMRMVWERKKRDKKELKKVHYHFSPNPTFWSSNKELSFMAL